jgi:hypothetical protein
MGRWGLLDGLLISFNIFPPDWLGSPGWARSKGEAMVKAKEAFHG